MRVLDLGYAAPLAAVDEPDAIPRLESWLATGARPAGEVLVGCPSTWGRPRRRRLAGVLTGLGIRGELVPRAVLIAASHADAAVQVCAVLETVLLPDAGQRWSGQLVSRTPDGWRITGSAVVDAPSGTLPDPALAEFLAPAGLVVVAGPGLDPERLPTAVRRAAGARRCSVEDQELTRRFGARCRPAPQPAPSAPPVGTRGGRLPQALLVGAVLLAALCGAAGVLGHRGGPPADSWAQARLGPVAWEVPAGWRRTELSGGDAADGRGQRAVYADRDDGRRLIAVVTALRAGSDRASVAESLAARLAQRGDDVVVEFAADGRYAGRPVISYREAPASGPPVRWYILVDGAVQVSLGCQAGTGTADIDPPCRRAVASVRVG